MQRLANITHLATEKARVNPMSSKLMYFALYHILLYMYVHMPIHT